MRPAAWGSGGRHGEISAEPVAILRIAVLVFGVEAARFECRAAPLFLEATQRKTVRTVAAVVWVDLRAGMEV